MDRNDSNVRIIMLSVDGSVKEIPLYLKDPMIKQGWKIISPEVADDLKQKGINYLPQYDQSINKDIKDFGDITSEPENNTLAIEVI